MINESVNNQVSIKKDKFILPNTALSFQKIIGIRRDIPQKLGQKLRAIRLWMNLSQAEMLRLVAPEKNKHHRALISQYETGRNEPSLAVLNRYAGCAGVSIETLGDDEMELPREIKKWSSSSAKSKRRATKITSKKNVGEGNHIGHNSGFSDESSDTLFLSNQTSSTESDFQHQSENGKRRKEIFVASASEKDSASFQENTDQPDPSKALSNVESDAVSSEPKKVNWSHKIPLKLAQQIDDLYLSLLKNISYKSRRKFSRRAFVEIVFLIVLDDYSMHEKASAISH